MSRVCTCIVAAGGNIDPRNSPLIIHLFFFFLFFCRLLPCFCFESCILRRHIYLFCSFFLDVDIIPFRLFVDAPRCRSVSAAGTVSGVSKQETASLDCQVDADPSNEVHFWWTFLGTPMKSKSMIKHNNNKKLHYYRQAHRSPSIKLTTKRCSASLFQTLQAGNPRQNTWSIKWPFVG